MPINELPRYRRSGITISSSGSSNDPDAVAFWTAAGITDSTERSAINQLVLDLKGTGSTTNNTNQWSKYYALYPISPTSLSAASYNLKDPTSFQITWFNSPTHTASGVTGNGSNQYGDTGFSPSTHAASIDNFGFTCDISAIIGTSSNVDMGSANGGNLMQISVKNASFTYILGDLNSSIGGNTTTSGVRTLSRTASNSLSAYLNGASDGIDTSLAGALTSSNFAVLARNDNGTPTLYSNRTYRFFAIHEGLTSNEAQDLYDAINSYNAALSR